MFKNQRIGQSAAKPRTEERSTTISKESTEVKLGKRPVYLKERNVIYKIINSENSKIYIGSAAFYDKRLGTHINLLRNNKHNNPHLQSAFNRYGEESFKFEIIEKVDKVENLLNREQYWLDFYKSYDRNIGYNISKIAGSNLGNKLSEKAKKKISEFQKNRPKSLETRNKFKKIQTAINGKRVQVFTKEMEFLNEFNSISECSREMKISIGAISKQCSNVSGNKRKTKNSKYIFRYKDIV